VDTKRAQFSHGISRDKFGNHCWAIQESIVVKNYSLLQHIIEKGFEGDNSCPTFRHGNTEQKVKALLKDGRVTMVWDHSARLAEDARVMWDNMCKE
jgi:hypothetical protein